MSEKAHQSAAIEEDFALHIAEKLGLPLDDALATVRDRSCPKAPPKTKKKCNGASNPSYYEHRKAA